MAPVPEEKESVQNQPNFEVRFVSTITSTSTTNSMVLKKSASPTNSVSTTSSTTMTSTVAITTTTTGRQSYSGTLQQQSVIKGGQETGRNCMSTGDSSNSPIVPISQTHLDDSDVSSAAPGSKMIAHHVKKRLLSCQRMLRLEAEEASKKQQPQHLSPAKDVGKATGSSSSASTHLHSQETASASEQRKQSRSEYDFPDSPDDAEPISRTSTKRYLSFSTPGLKWSSPDNAPSDPLSDSKMASSTMDTSSSTDVSGSSPVVSRSSLGRVDQPRLTLVETHSNLTLFSSGKEKSLSRENSSRGGKCIATNNNNCNSVSPNPSCVSTNDDDVRNLQSRADMVTTDKALKTDFTEDIVAATTITSSFQL